MEHLDRLTDQLAEAKMRARRFEAAATRLPHVEAEVARLRKQIDEGTSDRLTKLEDELLTTKKQLAVARDDYISLRRKWTKVLKHLVDVMPSAVRTEQMEMAMNLIAEAEGDERATYIDFDRTAGKIGLVGTLAIQRARGLRTSRSKPVPGDRDVVVGVLDDSLEPGSIVIDEEVTR